MGLKKLPFSADKSAGCEATPSCDGGGVLHSDYMIAKDLNMSRDWLFLT